jgi:hypothetical protein
MLAAACVTRAGYAMTHDFLRWFTLVVLVASLVLRLTSLARARARGEPPSVATGPDDDEAYDGSRRETWTMTRYLLVAIGAEACVLADLRNAARWIVLAAVAIAIGPDIVRWLRSRANRNRGGPTAEPSGRPAATSD